MATHCEACGERLAVASSGDRTVIPQLTRIAHGPDAGRATYLVDGDVVHQCAPGAFLPSALRATPRPDRIG